METEKTNIFHHFFAQLNEAYLDDLQLRELEIKHENINKTELVNDIDEQENEVNVSDHLNGYNTKNEHSTVRSNSQQFLKSRESRVKIIDIATNIKNDSKVHALKSFFENLSNNSKEKSYTIPNSRKNDLKQTEQTNNNVVKSLSESKRCPSKESLSYSDDTLTFDSISSFDSNDESIHEKKLKKLRSSKDIKQQEVSNIKDNNLKEDGQKRDSSSKEDGPKSNKHIKRRKKKRNSKEDLVNNKSNQESSSKFTKVNSKEIIKKDTSLRPRKESKSKRDSKSNKKSTKNSDKDLKPKLTYSWEIDPREITFEEKIGEGTSCNVYRGTYRGQIVALKVLKDSNKKQSENFIKEFDILSQFRSPYVVYFFGGCLEPIATMVLGYYPRGSLYDVLHDPTIDVNWSVVIKVVLNIIKGLDSMHNWKPQLVHRDLKSRNILVEDDWQIKLCDFGESRFAVYSNEDTLCKLRGTYAYVAPEIYFGHQFTVKSDIYSFGIVLWELCTRSVKNYYEAPYAKYKSLVHDYQIIIQTSKKGLRPEIDEKIPASMAQVIKKCWDPDPNKRPDTKDLVEYFEEIYKYQHDPTLWKPLRSSRERKSKRKLSRQ